MCHRILYFKILNCRLRGISMPLLKHVDLACPMYMDLWWWNKYGFLWTISRHCIRNLCLCLYMWIQNFVWLILFTSQCCICDYIFVCPKSNLHLGVNLAKKQVLPCSSFFYSTHVQKLLFSHCPCPIVFILPIGWRELVYNCLLHVQQLFFLSHLLSLSNCASLLASKN